MSSDCAKLAEGLNSIRAREQHMKNEHAQGVRELTEAELVLIAGGGFWGNVGEAAGAGAVVGGGFGAFFGPGIFIGAAGGALAAGTGAAIGMGLAKLLS